MRFYQHIFSNYVFAEGSCYLYALDTASMIKYMTVCETYDANVGEVYIPTYKALLLVGYENFMKMSSK